MGKVADRMTGGLRGVPVDGSLGWTAAAAAADDRLETQPARRKQGEYAE